MPEICRFEGIIIRMFWETGSRHHIPHLHASYQEQLPVIVSTQQTRLPGHCQSVNIGYSLPGLNFIVTNFKRIGNTL